jgi:hypothetical protein
MYGETRAMRVPAVEGHPDRKRGAGIQQTLTDRGFANRAFKTLAFFLFTSSFATD